MGSVDSQSIGGYEYHESSETETPGHGVGEQPCLRHIPHPSAPRTGLDRRGTSELISQGSMSGCSKAWRRSSSNQMEEGLTNLGGWRKPGTPIEGTDGWRSVSPRHSMGLLYMPTLGWFWGVNVGIYGIKERRECGERNLGFAIQPGKTPLKIFSHIAQTLHVCHILCLH